MWIESLSYVGSPIHITEQARVNDARAFFRVASNLRLARRCTLFKFSRFIRDGVLSCEDAQNILLNRLPEWKMRRYQLFKYWVSAGFASYESFKFNPCALWPKVEEEKENIIQFP